MKQHWPTSTIFGIETFVRGFLRSEKSSKICCSFLIKKFKLEKLTFDKKWPQITYTVIREAL